MFREAVAAHYRSKGYEVREGVKVRGASGNIHQVALVAEGPLGALVVSFGDAAGVDPAEMGSVRRIAKDVGATPVLAAPDFPPEFRRQAQMHGVVLIDGSLRSGGPEFPAPAPPASSPPSPWPSLQGAAPLDRSDLDAHPWPKSGQARPPDAAGMGPSNVDDLVASWERRAQAEREGPAPRETAAGAALWGKARAPAHPMPAAPSPAVSRRFAWLGDGPAPHPNPPAGGEGAAPEEEVLAAEQASILHAGGAASVRRRKAVPAPLIDARRALQILLYAALTALFVYLVLRLA